MSNSGTAVKALRRSSKNSNDYASLLALYNNLNAQKVAFTSSNSGATITFAPGDTTKSVTIFVPILNAVQPKRRIFIGRTEYVVTLNHNKAGILPVRVETLSFGSNVIDTGSFNLFAPQITGLQEYNESSPATWNINAGVAGASIDYRMSLLNPLDSPDVIALSAQIFLRGFYITVG